MVHFIVQYPGTFEARGARYVARVYADQQPRGLWEAWFVFFPLAPLAGGRPLATDQETTQSKREDLVYWANGITPVYLQGALSRAIDRLPETRLARHIAQAERQMAYARAEAEVYEAAAEEARAQARAAEGRRRAAARELGQTPRSAAGA